MAIGAFLGFSPLIGLHIPISILLCCVFRANVMVAVAATFVSNPFTIAGLAWLQLKLGRWLAPDLAARALHGTGAARYFAGYGEPLLLGSLVFSIVGGLLAYWVALWVFVERKPSRRR